MNGVMTMGGSEVSEIQPQPPGDDYNNSSSEPPPSKMRKINETGSNWHPKVPFNSTPLYDIKQTGDVKFGHGARSALLGILGGTLPRLSSEQHETVTRAKKYAMEQSIKMVLMKQTLAHQQQVGIQLASQRTQVQRQQALALMCRVYVGSISFELKEETIRAAFLPFGPIKSINMSWDPVTQKHKGFAFVEYEIPEGAQLALEQMNGAMLGGRNIKVVGRPSNMPQAQQVIDEIQEEAKNYNRIYIASIHPDLTEEDIKSVFEAFGPILYCKLSQGSSVHTHKGYGFIEYATKVAADESISSMNLFDLGGQLLRVGRSITPPNALIPSGNSSMPTAAAVAAAAATAKIQAMDAVATNAVLGLQQTTTQSLVIQQTITPAIIPVSIQVVKPVIPQPMIIQPQVITTPVTIPVTTTPTPIINAVSTNIVTQSSNVTTTSSPNSLTTSTPEDAIKKAQEKQQEELQKKLLAEEPQTLQQQETMSIKGQNARHLVMQRLMRPSDTKVVILRNMVGPDEVDETLQEEITDECSKFGIVERVIIYKEKQTENDDDDDDIAEVLVKIFVEFSVSDSAEKTRDALNGRYFGGKLVKAELYDQALFDHGDLSG